MTIRQHNVYFAVVGNNGGRLLRDRPIKKALRLHQKETTDAFEIQAYIRFLRVSDLCIFHDVRRHL